MAIVLDEFYPPFSTYQDGTWKTPRGEQIWIKDGKLHRDDGPAFIDEFGSHTEWYKNGKPHRIDGPACEIKFID